MTRIETLRTELIPAAERELRELSPAKRKLFKERLKALRALQIELNRLEGKTYDYPEWITSVDARSDESLDDARRKLIEKLSGMRGVTVTMPESGSVASVHVWTDWKVYHYTIHGHYTSKVVGYERRKGLFDESDDPNDWQEWPIYEPDYEATLTPDGSWSWRFE